MNLFEKTKESQSILSTTKPKDPILSVKKETKEQLKTKLRQKKKIVVYISDDKYYVEHSTAFSLGIINTRAIMLDKPKLIEISYDMHNKLKNNEEIEIEYITQKQEKQKLKVFTSDSSYCIENAAAYVLGLLSVEEFDSAESDYYYISKDFFEKLKEIYDIEMISMQLYEENNKKL